MAATIAKAMPVLPLVASIKLSPGLISPRISASTIMLNAGRSFTEPAGLLPSNFPKIKFEVCPGNRCKRTNGVLPTNSSMVGMFIRLFFTKSYRIRNRIIFFM